jgi:alpha-tubulin suppressor-like RCC1 family protein
VYAWGRNVFGQLGDGTTTHRTTPTRITFSGFQVGETIESVNAGTSHSLAVTTSGRVYAWGSNANGRLGDGTTTDRTSPTRITFSGLQGGETIESVNAGASHSLAVTWNGRVYAWGHNADGQLGDGTTTHRTTPTLITFNGLTIGENIHTVIAGGWNSLAVTTSGRVYAWGWNSNGQLGDGTTTDRTSPTLITFSGLKGGETIESVNAGFHHSLAVTTNGRVYAWGSNGNGRLGDGTTTNRKTPTIIITNSIKTVLPEATNTIPLAQNLFAPKAHVSLTIFETFLQKTFKNKV